MDPCWYLTLIILPCLTENDSSSWTEGETQNGNPLLKIPKSWWVRMDEQIEQTKWGGSTFLQSQLSQKTFFFLRGGDPVLNDISAFFFFLPYWHWKSHKKRMIKIVTAKAEKKKKLLRWSTNSCSWLFMSQIVRSMNIEIHISRLVLFCRSAIVMCFDSRKFGSVARSRSG